MLRENVHVQKIYHIVYVVQNHRDGEVRLSFRTDLVNLTAKETQVTIEVHSPDGEVYRQQPDGSIFIGNPKLWWPNGYGGQDLYTVTVRLIDDETGEELDQTQKRIGLRTVTVDTSPFPEEERDPHIGPQVREDRKEGRHFDFVVNGLRIFAMGGDYIPEDNILQRVTRDRTEILIRDAAEAHYNCIRIWGGGYYLDDFFYDLCDEYGLLLWQIAA